MMKAIFEHRCTIFKAGWMWPWRVSWTGVLIGALGWLWAGAAAAQSELLAGLPHTLSMSTNMFDGTNGFVTMGVAAYLQQDQFGASVCDAGDVNGDGVPDFLVGAPGRDTFFGQGVFALVYGRTNYAVSPVTALTTNWLDGSNGAYFTRPESAQDYFGAIMSAVGDVNGDGYDDFLFGEPDGKWGTMNNVGYAYLIYGGTNLPAVSTLTASWANGTNGVCIVGMTAPPDPDGDPFDARSNCGSSVGNPGDLNGDGLDDILVGSSERKHTYLIYGSTNLQATLLMMDTSLDTRKFVPNGTNGVLFQQNTLGGLDVMCGLGDVNGDGVPDFLVGKYLLTYNGTEGWAGAAYLVYGRTEYPANLVYETDVLDGTNGMAFYGTNTQDFIGKVIKRAGDVNGDGLADFLIGCPNARYRRVGSGAAYLVYGSTNLPASVLLGTNWMDGTNGVVLSGSSESVACGASVSGAGDVDGDGLDDILVGTPHAVAGNPFGVFWGGEACLVYGRTNFPAFSILRRSWLDGKNGILMKGGIYYGQFGQSVSGAGDMNGDGLADFLVGEPTIYEPGNTYLVYSRRPGIRPSLVPYTGGCEVVLSGTNLNDGTLGDVTSVTLGGATATVLAVNGTTQIVVIAGQGVGGIGDVRIQSATYGEIVRSNAFEYGAPYLGAEGYLAPPDDNLPAATGFIASGAPASRTNGTDFGLVASGTSTLFVITLGNTGTMDSVISSLTTNGTGLDMLTITNWPASLEQDDYVSFNLLFTPTTAVSFAASLVISNNSPASPFVINLAGASYALSANSGPLAGGNLITITNGRAVGDGSDITNVLVGDVSVTPLAQGSNWVSFVLPPGTGACVVSISLLSATQGSNLYFNAYTYNPAGAIGEPDVWKQTTTMPAARRRAYMGYAVYSNRLYSVGGMVSTTPYTNIICFDGTNWSETVGIPGGTSKGRGYLSSTVYNGSLYSIGGRYNNSTRFTNVFVHDGTVLSETVGLPATLTTHASATLGGKLYVIGGVTPAGTTTNVLCFDGAAWTQVAGLSTALYGLAAASYSGAIYTVGGYNGNSKTNVFRFDGTNWTEVAGLPQPRQYMALTEYRGKLWAVGGGTNRVYSFDGTQWREEASYPLKPSGPGAGVLNDTLYVFGGMLGSTAYSNTYKYQQGYTGVSPESGAIAGGYEVTIVGSNLCNGSDVTNVTICGVPASFVSQSLTQIVVTAGATGAAVTGDVQVFSTSYGITTRSQVFTYQSPTRVVLYDFYLRVENGQVQVCWNTASEEASVGFDLFRWQAGAWVKVNEALVLARDPMGASYCVADARANATDTFRYKLVEVETDGSVREYGPFERAAWTPRLENVGVGENGIVLRWLSRAGESYEVLKSRSLMVPLETMAGGVVATPPVNEFTDEEKSAGAAFYQIRVE